MRSLAVHQSPLVVPPFFEECKAYIGFGPAEADLLRSVEAHFAPHYERIAFEFYDAIARSPGAAQVIGSEQMRTLLHSTLQQWMRSGLRGPHETAYYKSRAMIGRQHVHLGLAQHYMVTALNVVRTGYTKVVQADVAPAQRDDVLLAIGKLLDLDLVVMLHAYHADSEERLVQQERKVQAERLLAMRTLSAGLAHEVRNPLNAAALQLELLSRRIRRGGDDPKLAGPTNLVHHELQRLSRLLTEFVSFARPPDLVIGRHDLAELVARVVEAERAFAAERGVTFALALASAAVDVDEGKIHQVVQNLLRNAVEASPRGSAVSVRVAVSDTGPELEILDHGCGIPADVLPRIYEPFFSTKEGGTGLGMSIVHGVVQQHGAWINVQSEPGQTCFRVGFAPLGPQ